MDTKIIKEGFRDSYNKAIELYNQQDYESFFQKIRKAIEWFCQLLVIDFLEDDNLADDLLLGRQTIIVEKGIRSLCDCYEVPDSRKLILLAKDAFFYTKQQSYLEKALKHEIESHFSDLQRLFSQASKVIHASYPTLNIETQARAYAPMLVAMFDYFQSNKILSKTTLSIFDGLVKIETSNIHEVTQMNQRLEEEEARRKKSEQKMQEAIVNAEAAKRERDELLEQIRLANEALEKKDAENVALHQSLATTKEKLESTTQKFGDLEQELDVLQECYSEALAQVDELEKKNQPQQEDSNEDISIEDFFELEEDEEISLDNLFDKEEEESLNEEPEELPDPSEDDTPDIKDRMVQKALRFIKQGLTPSQIIKEKRWRPINTYTRLTKLVELGYYDARKFIDDKTYDVIMESIKVLGSKADAIKLQDNCSKRVSLWQVKMILAELKFNKKVIPAQKKKVNDWFFVKGLVYSKNKTSKWFFEKKYNHKCRVVRSAAGYYLQLGEEFIKLGNYDSSIRYYDEGSIWVKSDYGNKLGHPLVHAIGKMTYLIGHIRDSKQKIIFTTPEGEEKTIIC